MQMSFWQLGLKNAWRDWRAGQLRLIVVAVALAVAALTAVGFFADRLKGGLERDARQLLGGDVVISSDRPTPPAFLEEARRRGLSVAATVSFPTMARARDEDGGESRLVAFKAVEAGYPLRGTMRVADAPGQPEGPTRDVPAPGQVWVDPGLLDALGLEPGQSLLLGEVSLRITRLIIQEPDRGAGFMSFSPRVMINQADVAATGLIQPASRTNYRLVVAGSDAQVRDYTRWVQAQIEAGNLRGLRIESPPRATFVLFVDVRGTGLDEDEATRVFDYGGDAAWHLVLDGEQQGPFTPLQIAGMISDGTIDYESYVWKEGFDGWKALSEVPELMAALGSGGEERGVLGIGGRHRPLAVFG